MRDRNYRRHSKAHYRPPSNSYEIRGGLSSSQCSPRSTTHPIRRMRSNWQWRPTWHGKGATAPHIPRNKGGLTLRASGVHIRWDNFSEDESADVDIATTDSLPSAEPAKSPRPTTLSRRTSPTRTPAATAKAKPDKCTVPMLPPAAKKEKPKSETYKQAWSVSEQHPLERLLSETSDGEKNRYERPFVIGPYDQNDHFRWYKISKAMGCRRTSRQVLSRVQRCFEKLKLLESGRGFYH